MIVLILSNTKNPYYFNMLKECVDSCYNSVCVKDVYVVETNSNLKDKDINKLIKANFIFPEIEFNYNKFLNIGIKYIGSSNEHILISNNDVVYSDNCIDKLSDALKIYDSVSPTQFEVEGQEYTEGYQLGSVLVGWSIGITRNTYNTIGEFDEQFSFWYQDNDYANTLKLNSLKHARVNNAIAKHKCQQSHNLLANQYNFTHGLESVYHNKWSSIE